MVGTPVTTRSCTVSGRSALSPWGQHRDSGVDDHNRDLMRTPDRGLCAADASAIQAFVR
jgi:hypothetical protein